VILLRRKLTTSLGDIVQCSGRERRPRAWGGEGGADRDKPCSISTGASSNSVRATAISLSSVLESMHSSETSSCEDLLATRLAPRSDVGELLDDDLAVVFVDHSVGGT
jgi:hypothetical protein